MYDALDVAKYIIRSEADSGRSVNNLRLQKLLYFVQVSFLIRRDEPCFDNRIEAWEWGPVVPEVYYKFSHWCGGAILSSFITDGAYISERDAHTISEMLDACSRLSTSELVNRSKSHDPWRKAYNSASKAITPWSIKSFYEKKLKGECK